MSTRSNEQGQKGWTEWKWERDMNVESEILLNFVCMSRQPGILPYAVFSNIQYCTQGVPYQVPSARACLTSLEHAEMNLRTLRSGRALVLNEYDRSTSDASELQETENGRMQWCSVWLMPSGSGMEQGVFVIELIIRFRLSVDASVRALCLRRRQDQLQPRRRNECTLHELHFPLVHVL
ncbi:hypothetical protein CBL_07127 [Carabus blaptoides fortunei]